MKLVTAVIRPSRLDEVKEALATAGVQGFTVSQIGGFGEQQGHAEVYRGARYNVDFLEHLRVEVVTSNEDSSVIDDIDQEFDEYVKDLISYGLTRYLIDFGQSIVSAACTGTVGDGIVWILPLDSVIHIRDGKEDESAL